MLCDTMDMTAATELAHRRLSDFIWRQSKAFKFDEPLLIHFTKCAPDQWPAVWDGLQEKGWHRAGNFVIHSGVIETHNAAQREYAAACNQTAAATASKTGELKLTKCVTCVVTGIVTLVVTSDVTNDVTRPQSKSKSESKSEPTTTSVPSQTSQSRPHVNGTMLTFSMLDRVAKAIKNNEQGWHYPEHKVNRDEIVAARLTGKMLPYLNRITEKQVHEAWQEAATRTHAAVKDELVESTPEGYCVACWLEQMTNIAEKVNAKS